MLTNCNCVSVGRRQKTAPLGAVFGVGLVALNSFYGLALKLFTVSSLYALAAFSIFFPPSPFSLTSDLFWLFDL